MAPKELVRAAGGGGILFSERGATILPWIPQGGIFKRLEGRILERGNELSVPGLHCGHCAAADTRELESVAGVEAVDVDLDSKRVMVTGHGLDDEELRAAIDEAGNEVTA